jgi:hypothetical protein
MSKVYITGDVHCPNDVHKLNAGNFPEQRTMTRDDVVIVAGDFGLVWHDDKTYHHWLDWFASRKYTLMWIDGNHENHDWLAEFPVAERFGGQVHVIAHNVLHMMRGEVFTINGKTWFAFGGAMSIDRHMRTPGQSWWPSELPSVAECNHGMEVLDRVNWQVDHVVTHTAPGAVLDSMFPNYVRVTDPTERYLSAVHEQLKFKHWWFGHWHHDLDDIDKQGRFYTCLYDHVVSVDD